MPVVDVVGVGEVEFPDEFTPEQIRDVLRQKFNQAETAASAGELRYPEDVQPNVTVEQELAAPPPTSNKPLDLLRRGFSGIAENTMLAGQGAGKLISTLPVPGMIADIIGPERTGEVRDIARSVQERAAEDYGVDPARSGEFSSKLVSGATSLVPIIASGPAAPVIGGAIAGESARQDAEERGASPLQQDIAFFGNAAVGAITEQLMGVPKILKIAREAGGGDEIAKSILFRAAVAALKSGASESGQEGLQQFAENWIARDIAQYDPKRSLKENVLESAVIGGIVGGGLGGTVATGEALTQQQVPEPTPEFPTTDAPQMEPVQFDPDTGFVAAGGQVMAPDASGNLKVVTPESAQGKAAMSLHGPGVLTPPTPAPAPEPATTPAAPPTPAPTTTTPASETPEATDIEIVAPALVMPDGFEKVGVIDQSHDDLRKQATAEDLELSEAEHMFKLSDGRTLNRKEAWDLAKQQGIIKPDVVAFRDAEFQRNGTIPELRTQDLLPRAQWPARTTPAAAPTTAPTTEQTPATESNLPKGVHVLSDAGAPSETKFAFLLDDGRVIYADRASAHFDLFGQLTEELADKVVDGGFVKGGAWQKGGDFSQGIRPGENIFDYYGTDREQFQPPPTTTPTPEQPSAGTPLTPYEYSRYVGAPSYSGPMSDMMEGMGVRLDGPSKIPSGLRKDVPSIALTDRLTGGTFYLPQDVTPEEALREINDRRRKFSRREATLPPAFSGTTEPLSFSPIEETTDASQVGETTPVYGGVQQPQVTPKNEGQVPVTESGTQVPPSVTEAPPPTTPPGVPPTAPAPTPSPSEDPLSIKNATVDQKRQQRGLAPRMAQLKRSFGFLWNQAMQTAAADPAAGAKLVDELAKTNRTPHDWEQALLLHEMVVRENEYHDAVDAVNEAKDEASRDLAREKLEAAADRNQQAYDVYDATGTSSGRSLNARKIMANRDFSRAQMDSETQAIVNNGAPLNEDQKQANEKLAKELDEVRKKLAALEAKTKAQDEQRTLDQLKKEEKARAKEVRAAAKQGRSILDLLEEKKDAAMKRIIDRRGKLNMTIDPLNIAGLVDEAIIGSYYIAKGLKSFTEWSAQMLKDFGNRIEPYLPALFEQSQQYHDANAKLFAEEDLVAQAKADAAEGKNIDPKLVFDLARQKVNQGVTELHNIMESVTNDLQAAYPGVTEREIRDAFSGYGKVRYPSKEADLKTLRELKRIAQLQSAIEDVMRKQPPKRSGSQRDEPTQRIREMTRELRELMRENGIETTSPERQLKSANDARVRALKNQIEDLDKRLRTGEKAAKKTKVPDSPEVERLRAERDAMQQLLDDIEAAENPSKTPEERAEEQAIKNVERSIAELDRRIQTGDISTRTAAPKAVSPKVERLRAQRDAMAAYLAQMRRDAQVKKTPEQRGIEAAQKARARWDSILKGETTTTRKTPTALTQEEADIRAEIEAMKQLAAELRAEARPKGDPESVREKREIAAAEKAIAEYERRAKALDFSPSSKVQGPVTARVAQVRAARDAARKAFEALREAARPKVDPVARQLEKDKRAIRRRIETMEKKIAAGDYTKPDRREPLMDKEKRALQFQEQKVKEKFYRGLLEAEMKKRTPIRVVWDNTMNVLGLMRAMKLSIDLGALGRQGGLLARGNPVRGVNALKAGLNAMRSEERHYTQLREIWERENGSLYKSAKLYIPDPTETKLSRLEEEYMSTLTRKVPLLAGSERGHVALLARLRADSFDAIIDAWFDGKPTAKQARAVAAFVNIATGRGELGQFAAAVPALNLVFNATSYYASRVQLLGYLARSAMPGSWTGMDPKVANAVRWELIKGVSGNLVWWSLMALAAKMLWPEEELKIELNPTSSDFGKIRSGKLVIDPLMGLTQYATLFARIFSGQMKTQKGTLNLRDPKFGGPTTESVIGTFAGQRLSPNTSMFRDLLRGSDYDKRKMSPMVFAENALPISVNETYELMRSQGIGPGSAMTMAMLLGDGVRVEQDYPGPLHSLFGMQPERLKQGKK